MGFFKARYVRDYIAASKVRSAVIWIVEILVVLTLAIVLTISLGKVTVMQEGSMEPTLEAGDKLLINRAAYRISAPKRGDLIVFYNGDEEEKGGTHIKRIIGLPGETIQIQEGKILIDGEILQEDGYFPVIENPGNTEEGITLGGGEYFVLGDNRNNSEDSRFVDIGCVKKGNIIGKLWFRISPKDSVGFLRETK